MISNTVIEKILGSLLLIAGLAIIGTSLYLGINVFIKAQNPPEIFKPIVATDTAEAPAQTQTPVAPLPQDLSKLTPEDIQRLAGGSSAAITPELIKAIIPPEMFNYTSRFMNLSVFSIFLWILITGGAKVASLGVALIKTNSDVKF